jgi:type II secretory pathway pseudopilin PulG
MSDAHIRIPTGQSGQVIEGMDLESGARKSSKLELAFAIVIVSGFLLMIIPSIINLFNKSKQDAVITNLGVLRSALSTYYTDNQQYPLDDLSSLITSGKYLAVLPIAISDASHVPNRKIKAETSPSDFGGWSYNNDPTDPAFGNIHIACTHPDAKGVVWSTY